MRSGSQRPFVSNHLTFPAFSLPYSKLKPFAQLTTLQSSDAFSVMIQVVLTDMDAYLCLRFDHHRFEGFQLLLDIDSPDPLNPFVSFCSSCLNYLVYPASLRTILSRRGRQKRGTGGDSCGSSDCILSTTMA